MKWKTFFQIILLLMVGAILMNNTDYRYYRMKVDELVNGMLEEKMTDRPVASPEYHRRVTVPRQDKSPVSRAGKAVIGKWKIDLSDGGAVYYLLLEDRSIQKVDQRAYESAVIVKGKPKTDRKATSDGFVDDIERYFKITDTLPDAGEEDLKELLKD